MAHVTGDKSMKWLEVIELRSLRGKIEIIEPEIRELIGQIKAGREELTINVYRGFTNEGDLSIHLRHETDPSEPGKSNLGLHLAALLRDFGLIHHNVWIEEYNQ